VTAPIRPLWPGNESSTKLYRFLAGTWNQPTANHWQTFRAIFIYWFLTAETGKTDLNGARSQWMAKPSSSLQILYSYVCAEGKAPPGVDAHRIAQRCC